MQKFSRCSLHAYFPPVKGCITVFLCFAIFSSVYTVLYSEGGLRVEQAKLQDKWLL